MGGGVGERSGSCALLASNACGLYSARAAPRLDDGGSSRQVVMADPTPAKALIKRDDLLASRLDSQPLDVEGAWTLCHESVTHDCATFRLAEGVSD